MKWILPTCQFGKYKHPQMRNLYKEIIYGAVRRT